MEENTINGLPALSGQSITTIKVEGRTKAPHRLILTDDTGQTYLMDANEVLKLINDYDFIVIQGKTCRRLQLVLKEG